MGVGSIWKLGEQAVSGGHGERVEREPITGSGGGAPSVVQGQSPWLGPLKLKAFWFLNVPRSGKTLRCLSRFDSSQCRRLKLLGEQELPKVGGAAAPTAPSVPTPMYQNKGDRERWCRRPYTLSSVRLYLSETHRPICRSLRLAYWA